VHTTLFECTQGTLLPTRFIGLLLSARGPLGVVGERCGFSQLRLHLSPIVGTRAYAALSGNIA